MTNAVKRLAVLGSTGSIGRQTLDVVRARRDRFEVVGLAAGNNSPLLAEQIAEFRPRFISHAASGPDFPGLARLSLEELASQPDVDIVVIATPGRAGLDPLLAAIRAGKIIALSNKEPLVMAGEIVTREARDHGARILPVDSEHSAIWQCLNGESARPEKIILTASGGPFRRSSKSELEAVTVEQALKHPSWKMGRKVTIDSATLLNKGLEVIEAHWLFNVPVDKIQVVIHPQSIIHSMVEFADGAIKAQLSLPDMRLPIQYALTYPDRIANDDLPKLDLIDTGKLTFEAPDMERFPCLRLAIWAGKMAGTYPAVLCGADETAVELFLSRQIRFMDIPRLIERVLERHHPVTRPALEDIRAADDWASREVTALAEVGRAC